MTVTSNEFGQQNIFAKEPQMVVEDYNRKGLDSPKQYIERYNGRWVRLVYITLKFTLSPAANVTGDDPQS